jgi:curved DNA-binding protein CbpA
MDDPYEVLGIAPSETRDTIRAAYRSLARRHHPDQGGDAHRMTALNAAWDILKDPDRRAAYDATGSGTGTPPAGVRPIWRPPKRPPAAAPSTILDFGRHAGSSIVSVAETDPDYLEWLVRAPIGRALKPEIEAVLAKRAAALGSLRPPTKTRPRRRRWSL